MYLYPHSNQSTYSSSQTLVIIGDWSIGDSHLDGENEEIEVLSIRKKKTGNCSHPYYERWLLSAKDDYRN